MHFFCSKVSTTVVATQLLMLHGSLAVTRTFELNISQGVLNPDCHKAFTSLVVNDQFPAPPIRVTKNDEVHIIVRNNAMSNQSTTIHYHGILQLGSCEADGVPGITQTSISPGETYHQRFRVTDQAGTYYYHAHVGIQDGTISGPFIVYDSEDAWPTGGKKKLVDGPYTYQDERVLFLSEWWHMADQERLEYYLGPKYNGMIGADSYLLNGRTVANGTLIDPSICPGYSVVQVKPNTTYRLRVVGALTMASLGVTIAEHNMTVIEVDGELIAPYNVSYLEVAPGQRFSVILYTRDVPKDTIYCIETVPLYVRETIGNGRAILKYTAHPKNDDAKDNTDATSWKATVGTKPPFPPLQPQWFFKDIRPLSDDAPLHDGPPDRTIIIKPTEVIKADNTTRWELNGRMFMDYWGYKGNTKTTMLARMRSREQGARVVEEADGFDPVVGAFRAKHNEVLDLVIHTTVLSNGFCVGHPWHTHGYTHYVLADGSGEYLPERDGLLRTYPSPTIARDTTFIYPVQPAPLPSPSSSPSPLNALPGTICGWTKIRMYTASGGHCCWDWNPAPVFC